MSNNSFRTVWRALELLGQGPLEPEVRRALLPGLRIPSQLLRWAMIKLVHRPGRPLEAKAYPEFHVRPAWFD